jgi:nitroreductase
LRSWVSSIGYPDAVRRTLSAVDTYLAIASRREVREYDSRPLPDDAVRRILDAGRVAGSSANRQRRRFVVLRDRAVVERAAGGVYTPGNLLGAALVVAVVVGGKGPVTFDAGRAAQNMLLAAWNEGIGSCPNGIADADRLADAVGHGPEERVATVLSFGYPARRVNPDRRSASEWIERADRLPFEDIVEER